MSQKYDSPAAFEQALERRLQSATRAGVRLARTRQLAVFDRLLARIAAPADRIPADSLWSAGGKTHSRQ